MINPSGIDDAINNMCMIMKSQSSFEKVNTAISQRMKSLHDKWVVNGDIFALLEANYIVDFYCSHIVNYCDSNARYDRRRKSPSGLHKSTRGFQWEQTTTYDVFKQHMSYADGFRDVKRLMLKLRKEFMKKASGLAPDQVTPKTSHTAYHVELDWRTMLQRYPLKDYVALADKTIDEMTTYNASGWGMYRLVNLNNNNDKLPASCITKSLMLLSILYMTGFPRDSISTYYQIPKNATYKKYTHWASLCHNPFDTNADSVPIDVVPTMRPAAIYKFWSTRAFSSFTREIVRYYKMAVDRFVYAPGAIDETTRLSMLADLKAKLVF